MTNRTCARTAPRLAMIAIVLGLLGALIPAASTTAAVPGGLAIERAGLPAGVSSVERRRINDDVADIMIHNPGSRRLNATSVLVAPGVMITVPGPIPASTRLALPAKDGGALVSTMGATQACDQGYLCMWVNSHKRGDRLALWWCGDVELSRKYWGSRGQYTWQDNISSIFDNQTGSPTSYFYDYDSHGGAYLLGTARPGTYWADLAYKTTNGHGWNDRIDRVRVC